MLGRWMQHTINTGLRATWCRPKGSVQRPSKSSVCPQSAALSALLNGGCLFHQMELHSPTGMFWSSRLNRPEAVLTPGSGFFNQQTDSLFRLTNQISRARRKRTTTLSHSPKRAANRNGGPTFRTETSEAHLRAPGFRQDLDGWQSNATGSPDPPLLSIPLFATSSNSL